MPATDAQKAALLADRTAGYMPQSLRPSFMMRGLPPFTLWTAKAMQDDDAVRLGLAIKLAPHTTAKLIAEGVPEVAEFVQKTIESVWASDLPRILSAFSYSRCVAEVLYRFDPGIGKIVYAGLREFDPADANLLLRNGEQYGLRVRTRTNSGTVDLTPPKAFAYVHGREFNGWEGRSELAGAYEPWLEKTDRVGGAKESRRRYMHTRAFHGGIIWYPPGSTPDETGRRIPNIDIARAAVENAQNGAVFAFPNTIDSQGNPEWKMEWTGGANDGAPLIEYVETLSVEITRGMGIPDDIVVQTGDGGSYAGRRIPLLAFFKSEQLTLRAIVAEVKRQIVDPLVWVNFGAVDYSISAEIDESVFEPKEAVEPNLAPRAGGLAKPDANKQPGQNPPKPAQLSEFKESEHPRDDDGKFTEKATAAYKRDRQPSVSKATVLRKGVRFTGGSGDTLTGDEIAIPGFEEYRLAVVDGKVFEMASGAYIGSGKQSDETDDAHLDRVRSFLVRTGKDRLDWSIQSRINERESDRKDQKNVVTQKVDYPHDKATGRVNGYDIDPPGTEPKPLAGDPAKIVKREPEIGGRAMREHVNDLIGAKPEEDSKFDKAEFIAGLRNGNDVPDDFLKNAERARYRIEMFLEDLLPEDPDDDDPLEINGESVDDHTNRMFHAWAPTPEAIADAVEKALNEAKKARDEKRAARIAAKKAAKATPTTE